MTHKRLQRRKKLYLIPLCFSTFFLLLWTRGSTILFFIGCRKLCYWPSFLTSHIDCLGCFHCGCCYLFHTCSSTSLNTHLAPGLSMACSLTSSLWGLFLSSFLQYNSNSTPHIQAFPLPSSRRYHFPQSTYLAPASTLDILLFLF